MEMEQPESEMLDYSNSAIAVQRYSSVKSLT